MGRYILTGVAEVEATDDVSAWEEAQHGARLIRWEVSEVAPLARPDQPIAFRTQTGDRVGRIRLLRTVALAAAILAGVVFPSHLVLNALFPRW